MKNIHASTIVVKNKGIMFTGKSGSGKSTACLMLMNRKDAKLVCDDRTDIKKENDKIIAHCPETISGLLEIYGFGIINVSNLKSHKVDIVIELKDVLEIERMPLQKFYEYEGIKIKKYDLSIKDIAFIDKLDLLIDETETKS